MSPLSIVLISQADPSVSMSVSIVPGDAGDAVVNIASPVSGAESFSLANMTSPDALTLKAQASWSFFDFSVVFALGDDPTAPIFSMDVEGAPIDNGKNVFTLSAADYVAAKAFFANYVAAP